MLQEAVDLQQNAVAELVNKLKSKKEITFRAPTGSGKTRMMADFMNRAAGSGLFGFFTIQRQLGGAKL